MSTRPNEADLLRTALLANRVFSSFSGIIRFFGSNRRSGLFGLHITTALIGAGALLWSAAFAGELSPVGLWKTIDDNTGNPRGLVRIMEVNGEYQGKVEKIFPKPGEDPDPKCEKCDGVRHNQPVIGMTILWGLTKQGDEYQGGTILDPENGKVYRAKMKVAGDGGKLGVRGFIGFSLIGRTQNWIREQ